jgi:hypothetical protein
VRQGGVSVATALRVGCSRRVGVTQDLNITWARSSIRCSRFLTADLGTAPDQAVFFDAFDEHRPILAADEVRTLGIDRTPTIVVYPPGSKERVQPGAEQRNAGVFQISDRPILAFTRTASISTRCLSHRGLIPIFISGANIRFRLRYLPPSS